MRYHITYIDRTTGRTETGRVFVTRNPSRGADRHRAAAIQAAYFKYPNARRSSIRAVGVAS